LVAPEGLTTEGLSSSALEVVQTEFKRVAKEFEEIQKGSSRRRRRRLGDYFKSRYGEKNPPPWQEGLLTEDDIWLHVADLGTRIEDEFEPVSSPLLTKWAKSIWQHDEFEVGGKKFRTKVSQDGVMAYPPDREVYINGTIEAFDDSDGSWREVGYFMRRISEDNPGVVYSDELKIGTSTVRDTSRLSPDELRNLQFGDSVKGSGFASILNGHAFSLLRSSGFTEAEVSAVDDGAYVWGKIGYRSKSKEEIKKLVEKFRNELKAFRSDRDSIIEDENQAEIVEYLLELARSVDYDPDGPQWPEFIEAVLIGAKDRDRASRVKAWFQSNIPFDKGVLPFTDDLVPLDPRVNE
jgi:hypothetical protein